MLAHTKRPHRRKPAETKEEGPNYEGMTSISQLVLLLYHNTVMS